MDQINMFEELYNEFKFTKKKITLFEAFAGIGSQHIALDILAKEFNFELDVIGISEWDYNSILSYDSIHTNSNNIKFKEITKLELEKFFADFVLSSNGKDAMTQKQISRISLKKSLQIYKAILREKNYGSITDIQEIPQVDIFTYSFPCQDISLAGNQKGFSKGSGTRSGLLWEVERLLENQEKLDKLPKVLLMENVKALVGMKFKDDFIEWQLKLESLGYRNYWEVLNAKNYGIPQNRERVFMISILGDYHYNFPKGFPLKLRLKDMLEDKVDDKYYLSDKQMEQLKVNGNMNCNPSGNGMNGKINNSNIANTITTNKGEGQKITFTPTKNKTSNVIGNLSGGKWDKINESARRVYDIETHSPTIHTMQGGNTEPKILIPEMTKKGYAEAGDGDGIYINRPHQKRGVVQKGMIQTIKTSPDIGVVVKGNYSPSNHNASRIVGKEGIAPTVMENHGTVTAIENNLRIRKLTPKECWRLMGINDQDFAKAEKVCSNSQLYKQAGNSIVVDILYYKFKNLF